MSERSYLLSNGAVILAEECARKGARAIAETVKAFEVRLGYRQAAEGPGHG